MGLSYYRDKLHSAVTAMAQCSGGFSERLLVAWHSGISTMNWDDFESCLMPDDYPVFQRLKQLFTFDLPKKVEKSRPDFLLRAALDSEEVSEAALAKFVNFESVIKAMHGNAARKYIQSIVEMYSVVVSSVDYQTAFPLPSSEGSVDE